MTSNQEFKQLTIGLRQAEIVRIFNEPDNLDINIGTVKTWLSEPHTTYFRNMPKAMLELFKRKLADLE